ncbi:uncharacterized protein Neos [Drosophila tropicalis]|uniref:uncharacterized protein Neos n=1 Tax=Drosophila tropicalis TaxID=46794 RepID=UPI0035ABEE96
METTREPDPSGYNIAKDPALKKNRIFLGNIPICTRKDLESICQPYGNVLGSVVQKNFGFVQFESEEIANKAATALNRSTFKSNTLTVRNASIKTTPVVKNNIMPMAMPNQMPMPPVAIQGGIVMSAAEAAEGGSVVNDCEIVVVNRENTKYAEYVEERLRNVGMRVDVLFPNEDVMLGKVLANISSRGCLYAVLVTAEHESLNSITVNILYGVPAEHRNMPLEDAITLVATDFRLKKQRDAVSTKVPGHPFQIRQLLDMLCNNHPLTALQYDCLIKYLESKRQEQMKRELGDANALAKLKAPDPEVELQKKILSIMNKPAVTDISYELMYPTLEAVKEDHRFMALLKDARVLSALESIWTRDLIDTVAEFV